MSNISMPSNSANIAALLERAKAQHQAGDLLPAKAAYLEVLAQAPDQAEALYLAGALDHQLGDQTEAVRKLTRALAVLPNYLPALEMLGAAAAKAGMFEQAADSFAAAIAQKPAAPELHYNHGVVLFQAGRYDKAETALRQVVTLNPTHAEAFYLFANALRLQGQNEAAANAYARLIAIKPAHARALDEYGGVLFELGRIQEAEHIIRRAIAAAPELANPYTNLGRLYHTDAVRAGEALALHDQSIARAPNYAEAHNNRGVALQLIGRTEDALAAYDKAIALKPNYAEAHRNKGLASLMLRRWKEGWTENEWRFKCRGIAFTARDFPQPVWQGKAPDGALLLWGEQGIGDEILYGSMVGDLVERGYSLVWEADARLKPLIARSYPGIRVIARTSPPDHATTGADISAQISTTSLGQYLRAATDSFPAPRRYLRADSTRAATYRERLCAGGKTRVIGISWASANQRFGAHKSSHLAAWQALCTAAGPDTRFVDLQYGDTARERGDAGMELMHFGDLDLMDDIDGLAALITACDHVVSVSNTTAHLACALNVPTSVLVPIGNGQLWYWGAEGRRTPWYPSATIFRQPEPGRWEDVLSTVAQDIATAP
jgi:tetratricopeptide (TPR) repeat protein